jgi:DNA invertase Pin-like site-specific DNA recombinase
MGRFFLTPLLTVAEMERNIIVERTQEGKTIARKREGFREGTFKSASSTSTTTL